MSLTSDHNGASTPSLASAPLAVSIKDACALSGLSRASLYRVIAAGGLRPRKLGARTIIIVEELRQFLLALPS